MFDASLMAPSVFTRIACVGALAVITACGSGESDGGSAAATGQALSNDSSLPLQPEALREDRDTSSVSAERSASIAADDVHYAAPPSWIVAAPVPTEGPTPEGAHFRVEYLDYQIYAGPDGDEFHSASRTRILDGEGLAAGNIVLNWNPDAGDATVHHLRILRGRETIDVLESTKFEVLRREGYLENAVLNGHLTATLQVPGLQIGDRLEIASTIRRKDPTLGDRSFGFVQLPALGLPGAFRARIVWPASDS
jgi:hypothetical protein